MKFKILFIASIFLAQSMVLSDELNTKQKAEIFIKLIPDIDFNIKEVKTDIANLENVLGAKSFSKILSSMFDEERSFISGDNKFFLNLKNFPEKYSKNLVKLVKCNEDKICIEHIENKISDLIKSLQSDYADFINAINTFKSKILDSRSKSSSSNLQSFVNTYALTTTIARFGLLIAGIGILTNISSDDKTKDGKSLWYEVAKNIAGLSFGSLNALMWLGVSYLATSSPSNTSINIALRDFMDALKAKVNQITYYLNDKNLKNYFTNYALQDLISISPKAKDLVDDASKAEFIKNVRKKAENVIAFLENTYKEIKKLKSGLTWKEYFYGTDKYDSFIIDLIFKKNPLNIKLLPLKLDSGIIIDNATKNQAISVLN